MQELVTTTTGLARTHSVMTRRRVNIILSRRSRSKLASGKEVHVVVADKTVAIGIVSTRCMTFVMWRLECSI